MKQLLKEHEMEFFLKTYFEKMHDGRIIDCKTRLIIPGILIKEYELTKDIILKTFKFSLKKMVNLYADFPGLFKYYGYLVH